MTMKKGYIDMHEVKEGGVCSYCGVHVRRVVKSHYNRKGAIRRIPIPKELIGQSRFKTPWYAHTSPSDYQVCMLTRKITIE